VNTSEREETVVYMWGEMPDIIPSQKYKHKVSHIYKKIHLSPSEGNWWNSWWDTSWSEVTR
jgi:hypothetical protein